MIKPIRKLTSVVLIMFLSLFGASTGIQVITADALNQDSRNVRASYAGYETLRGSILIDSSPIAASEEVDDAYRYQRYYDSELYAHLTGYFSIFQPSTGIEQELNNYLAGQSSAQFFEQINAVLAGTPISGANVELTIDPEIQQLAWDALGSNRGSVVVLDPKTGNIKAMVSKPSFDPNLMASHSFASSSAAYEKLLQDPDNPLLNRSIAGDLYHPGSVFKLVVAAAALESGIDAETEFDNPAVLQLPNSIRFIRNANDSTCGDTETVTLRQALVSSCNIPFAEIGLEVGASALRAQSELFGFGKNLSVPLQVTPSIFPSDLDPALLALTSFGQYDTRVTPLQVAMVSAAIANQGILMQPQLLKRVVSSNLELIEQPEQSVYSSPISRSTAGLLTQMMFQSVESGTTSRAQIPGLAVAGKTGTAESGPGEPYTLWFTGFAPAQDPELVVVVVVEGNDQDGTGNSIAAPIGRQILRLVDR